MILEGEMRVAVVGLGAIGRGRSIAACTWSVAIASVWI
jgi:hypothetical protein